MDTFKFENEGGLWAMLASFVCLALSINWPVFMGGAVILMALVMWRILREITNVSNEGISK